MGNPDELRNVTKKPQWVPWCRQCEMSLSIGGRHYQKNPVGSLEPNAYADWQNVLVSNLKTDNDALAKTSLHQVES